MPNSRFIEYHIDDLCLNTQLGSLHRDGQEIPLPQLSYKMLCVLVEQAPAIVSQNQLMNLVWGEQVVSDETLKQRIKLLRQALNDTPQSPKYIESVRGRGYRCIASVKQQIITSAVQHDSINLRIGDRLPVSFIQTRDQYWPMAAAFFVVLLTVFTTVITISFFSDKSTNQPASSTVSQQLTQSQQAQAAYDKGRRFYLRYQSLDNEMAIKSYQQAINFDSDFAHAYAGLADAYSQGVFQFSADGSWQKKALDAAYDAVMINDQLAVSYKSLSTAHYINGHISQALTASLKALAINPNHIDTQATLGYLYSERGQLQQALKHHKAVSKLNPNHHLNWFHQGLTYARLGEHQKALSWFEKVQANHPQYHLSTLHYSQLLQQLGQHQQALTLLQQAEQQSPDSLNILKGLAHFYLFKQQLEQALPWIHKLQLLSKGENRQYAQLLLLLEQNDSQQQLTAWYAKYSESYNERPFHNIQLALAASALKDNNGALRHLTQAIELGWRDSYYLEQLPFFEGLRLEQNYQRIITLLEGKTNLSQ